MSTADFRQLPDVTARLRLREFARADHQATLAYHQDPRFLRFYPEEHGSESETRQLVEMFISWQQEQPRYRFQWVVSPTSTDALIGNCGIRLPAPDALQAEIGFELAPAYWGRGYATELAGALLRFGFEELGLHRITAHCIAENLGSARVLQKVGMRGEGCLREAQHMRDRWWDVLLFGILEWEWRDRASSRLDRRDDEGRRE